MNDTKVVSARIPMSAYLELVRRARNAQLSISDYIISTLFDDIETQVKREEIVETLTENAHTYRFDNIKTNLLLQKEVVKSAQLEEQKKALEQRIIAQVKNHNIFVDEVLSFVKSVDNASLFSSYKGAIEFAEKSRWQEIGIESATEET